MITIGVLSDTHIRSKGKGLPQNVVEALSRVDFIIHAGDINEDFVLYELEEMAKVYAVAGNTDDEYMRGLLGTKRIVEVGDVTIGIIHGDGYKGTTLERARTAFSEEKVDCIVFGHSHIPFNQVIGGVLMFNPGSSTDKRRQEKYSYGILKIDKGHISGEIIFF